ncbi:MAG: GspH/FimT family pseudopilin [Sedimentisphaerales bacterium]|nr:GspH/FimT family pseudopilin [Sedimentisphaerales bacterium]
MSPNTQPYRRDATERSTGFLAGTEKPGNAGFTLIELMIVVVIIGLAAAIAVPMMSSAASFQIRAGANMVAADLEYAKSLAISRGQYYSVVFDPVNETYRIEDKYGAAVSHPITKDPSYVVDFRNNSRVDRVDIVSAAFDGQTTVTFDYLGSPYSGSPLSGMSPLLDGTITLQAGDAQKTITIEPVTGYISVSD